VAVKRPNWAIIVKKICHPFSDIVTGKRKALESQKPTASMTKSDKTPIKLEPDIPCWVEAQQTITYFPASIAKNFHHISKPLIHHVPKSTNSPQPQKIIFPLSSDHLIVIIQLNVLRGSLYNRALLTNYLNRPIPESYECSSAEPSLHLSLPPPTTDINSPSFPPCFYPTQLQLTIPHEEWIDIIPHPKWRDNIIMAIGSFDEDELWSDTSGGLFEGFPVDRDKELGEGPGIIAWNPPWDFKGWEIQGGFLRKWGWSLRGCEEVIEATNVWRARRGEDPLVLEVEEEI